MLLGVLLPSSANIQMSLLLANSGSVLNSELFVVTCWQESLGDDVHLGMVAWCYVQPQPRLPANSIIWVGSGHLYTYYKDLQQTCASQNEAGLYQRLWVPAQHSKGIVAASPVVMQWIPNPSFPTLQPHMDRAAGGAWKPLREWQNHRAGLGLKTNSHWTKRNIQTFQPLFVWILWNWD